VYFRAPEMMIGRYWQVFRVKSRVLDWQLLVGRWTCTRGVNDSRCDEGGMQLPPGVEMGSLLTGESVCLRNNGARAGEWSKVSS